MSDDIVRATTSFHPTRIVREESHYKMLRGFLDGRSIIIAKYIIGIHDDIPRSRAIRDIAISIQMSNHENILKLLGCCLELPAPVMVHANAAKGVLNGDGSLRGDSEDQIVLPWNIRLHIAKQVASEDQIVLPWKFKRG